MSEPETIEVDGDVRGLGCLVPDEFPTNYPSFVDTFAGTVLSMDQIRAELSGKPSMYSRRQRFAGPKYIRNQKKTNGCNGWATAAMLSRVRELRGEPYVCLSGADAYSQMNDNRDQGSTLARGLVVCQNGIAPESLAPDDRIYASQVSAEARASRTRYKGFKPYAVDTEEELATGLLLGHCGVIAVHVTQAFYKQDGDGVNQAGNGVGNHAVGVQDLRLGRNGDIQFDMPNSWDTTYLDGGYTWLTWAKHMSQCVKNHRYWLLVSSTDDEGDNSNPPKVKV